MQEQLFKELLENLGKNIKEDIDKLDEYIAAFKENYVAFRKNDKQATEKIINNVNGIEKFVNGETEHGIPFANAVFCVGGLFSEKATEKQVKEAEETLQDYVYGNLKMLIKGIEEIESIDEEMFLRMYNALHIWKRNAKEFLNTTNDIIKKRKEKLQENLKTTQNKNSELQSETKKEKTNEDVYDIDEDYDEDKKTGLKIISALSVLAVILSMMILNVAGAKILSVIFYILIGVIMQRYVLIKPNKKFTDYLFFIIHLPSIVLTIISFVIEGNTDSGTENEGFADKAQRFFTKCENWLDKKIEEGNSKDSDYQFTLTDEHGNKRKLKYNMYVGPGSKKEYKDDVGDTWYTDDEGKHFYRK